MIVVGLAITDPTTGTGTDGVPTSSCDVVIFVVGRRMSAVPVSVGVTVESRIIQVYDASHPVGKDWLGIFPGRNQNCG